MAPCTKTSGGGEEVELTITGLAAGGDAIGRDGAGRAVFIAGAVPGEVVRAKVVEVHARWARAELMAIVTAVPARVTPACKLFADGACGGCAWQHVAIEAQREAKQALLAGALRRLIAGGLELRPLAAPVADLGWRWRARWTALGGAVGYHRPRGHDVVDVDACPQLTPGLAAVLAAVRAMRATGAITGDGEIHAVAGPGGAHVVIEARATRAVEALLGQADLRGVVWSDGAVGADAVELEPGLWVRGNGFAQASAAGNAALVALVAEAAGAKAGERVLELHAGAGNFTRGLVAAGARVIAVDEHAPPRLPTDGRDLRVASVALIVAGMVKVGDPVDVVVLDPPRTGAREIMDGIAALKPRRVVYVACDPATFARDADHLVAAGYVPRWAQGLDLMPQTAHVELVAVFAKP